MKFYLTLNKSSFKLQHFAKSVTNFNTITCHALHSYKILLVFKTNQKLKNAEAGISLFTRWMKWILCPALEFFTFIVTWLGFHPPYSYVPFLQFRNFLDIAWLSTGY